MVEVAFRGELRTILWARDTSGRLRGKEYFDALPRADQAKVEALFRFMGGYGQIRNIEKFRYEDAGIYCFKSGLHRFPCFLHQSDVVITHGFLKRHPKMPTVERDRALRIRLHLIGDEA